LQNNNNNNNNNNNINNGVVVVIIIVIIIISTLAPILPTFTIPGVTPVIKLIMQKGDNIGKQMP
jgi:hypothetical protein